VYAEHLTFVANSRTKMAIALREALADNQRASLLRMTAEAIMDDWDKIRQASPENMIEGEEALWCSVWAGQHLGDESHMDAGSANCTLEKLLASLEENKPLPQGWHAARP
jgi:hypothetical protein